MGQNANKDNTISRRNFLRGAGSAAAIAAVGSSGIIGTAAQAVASDLPADEAKPGLSETQRSRKAFQLRRQTALAEHQTFAFNHPTNGDEALYANKIGSYSKGMPHDALGEVDLTAWNSLVQTLNSGDPEDFEELTLGGAVPLIDPQSGLAFDLEGQDGHGLVQEPPPALASAEEAGEEVELYWAALLRDIPFSQYPTNPLVAQAVADLNKLSDFRGPKVGGLMTPGTLFRGFTPGDLIGPYFSQYLYRTLQFGAATIVQQFQTYLPVGGGGQDYNTTFADHLACQNGTIPYPFKKAPVDPQARYLRNGRDISAWVHIDVLYQAYLHACIYLLDIGAPLNPGNPYLGSKTQVGFGTFGAPHIKAFVAEVATRALKAVWYQKWYVHRRLRPEAYGGLVHATLAGLKTYPVHADVLNSAAVAAVNSAYGTWMLPMAFPEGCPQHPSYGAGHATVAGACVTILKAFFDETFVLPNPVVPSDDGLTLLPYTGPDAGQITVGGELNKVAANVAIGRNIAGVHWRSDYTQSLLLGEALAITILQDQKVTYNELFKGFTFTKFDGTKITV
jgi:hypothetical protein